MNSNIAYRQQFTRCGKKRCRKCSEGEGHGPYWYAYWSENGHTVSRYIGVRPPPDIEIAQQPLQEQEEHSAHNVPNSPPSTILRVYVLGQFRVERRIGSKWHALDNSVWQHRRARTLFGCLLSSTGR